MESVGKHAQLASTDKQKSPLKQAQALLATFTLICAGLLSKFSGGFASCFALVKMCDSVRNMDIYNYNFRPSEKPENVGKNSEKCFINVRASMYVTLQQGVPGRGMEGRAQE